jgi:hypothetical protein
MCNSVYVGARSRAGSPAGSPARSPAESRDGMEEATTPAARCRGCADRTLNHQDGDCLSGLSWLVLVATGNGILRYVI